MEFTFRPVIHDYGQGENVVNNSNNSIDNSNSVPGSIPISNSTEVSNLELFKLIWNMQLQIQDLSRNQSNVLNELKTIKVEQNILKTNMLQSFVLESQKIDALHRSVEDCNSHTASLKDTIFSSALKTDEKIDISELKIRRAFKEHFETMARFQEQMRDQFLEKIKEREAMERERGHSNSSRSSGGDDIWNFLKFFMDVGGSALLAHTISKNEGRNMNGNDFMNIADTALNHSYMRDSDFVRNNSNNGHISSSNIISNILHPNAQQRRQERNSVNIETVPD